MRVTLSPTRPSWSTSARPPTHAYERIRQAIVEGTYPQGQRLVEQRIAEELELSRTPVREALHRLEAEGLIQSEPHRGAVVRDLSASDIADIYGLRARMEAYAAELAATRAEAEDLIELDAGIEDFERALAAHDRLSDLEVVRLVHAANQRIHVAILVAARHDRLAQALGRTVDVPLVFQAFRDFDRDEVERSNLFHQCIRDAIVARDGTRAGNLMSEHVLQGRDSLLAHLNSREEPDEEE